LVISINFHKNYYAKPEHHLKNVLALELEATGPAGPPFPKINWPVLV